MKSLHRVIVILLISNIISDCHCGLKEYGESCSERKPSQRCRMDLDLTCEDGTCTCTELSVFDEDAGACVALIGESCSRYRDQDHYGRKTLSRCPKNSVCSTNNPNKTPRTSEGFFDPDNIYRHHSHENKCYCKEGYYPDPHEKSTCIKALKANEPCDASGTLQCHKDAGLTCDPISSTCQCTDQENASYNEEEKRCLVKVGTNCTTNTFCDKNAICSASLRLRDSYPDPTEEDIEKLPAICVCLPGFQMHSNGKCLGSYSIPCSESRPCNSESFLSCIDGFCQCEAGDHQVFTGVPEKASCKFLVNSTCKFNGDGANCVDNAECITNDFEHLNSGICQCKTGYSPSPFGQCLSTYTTECTSLDMFNNTNLVAFFKYRNSPSIPENGSCNFYEGLACVRGKCECFDSGLVWDDNQGMCIATEGQRCGVIEFNYGNDPNGYQKYSVFRQLVKPAHFYYVGCGENKECVKNKNGVEGWSTCAASVMEICSVSGTLS